MYFLPKKKKRFCNWTLFLEQPCNPEIREKLKRPFSNSQGKGLPLQSTSIRFSLRTLQEQNIPTESGDRRLPTDSGWFADVGGAGWPFPDAWSWLGSAPEPTSSHQQVKMEERGTKLSPSFLVKARKRQLPPGGYKRGSLFISVGEGSRPLTRGRGKGKKRDESRVEKRTRRVRRTDFRTPPSREPEVWGAPPSNLWSDAQITPKTPGTYTGSSTWREATLYCRLSPSYPSRSRSRCDSSHCDTRNTHSFAARGLNSRRQVEPSPALPFTPDWSAPLLCTFRLVEGAAAPLSDSPPPGAVPPTIPRTADWSLSKPDPPLIGLGACRVRRPRPHLLQVRTLWLGGVPEVGTLRLARFWTGAGRLEEHLEEGGREGSCSVRREREACFCLFVVMLCLFGM